MRDIRNVLSTAALAAFVCAAAAPASANLVSNGSFEDVSGNSSASFFLSDLAGTLTDWTTSSNADSNNVLFASPTGVATRHDGAQFGFWSGVTSSPDGAILSLSTEIRLAGPGKL